MATVSPIGSNRLTFSREKVLKLTYNKEETQICAGNTPDPPLLQGREKGERGEEGGVGERRELRGRREKMGKGRGEANKARGKGG